MSNLNTILNKLGKIEAINETNLGKHEVELNIFTDFQKNKNLAKENYTKGYAKLKEVVGVIDASYKFLNEAEKSGKEADRYIKMFEERIKALGITLPSEFIKDKEEFTKLRQEIDNVMEKYINISKSLVKL